MKSSGTRFVREYGVHLGAQVFNAARIDQIEMVAGGEGLGGGQERELSLPWGREFWPV